MLDPRHGENLYHPADDEDLREADRAGTGLELSDEELLADIDEAATSPFVLVDDEAITVREPAPWAMRVAS